MPVIDFGLFDKFEYEGFWWLPENPNKQIPGKLVVDPTSSIKLSLIGMFHELPDALKLAFQSTGKKHPVVHGFTLSGKVITLRGCIQSNFSFNSPGIPTQKFVCEMAFVGVHMLNPDTDKFRGSYFRFDHIEEWLGVMPFKQNFPDAEKKKPYTLTLDLASSQEHAISSLDANLIISSSFSTADDAPRKMAVTMKSWLQLKPNIPQPIEWHLKAAIRLRDFAALCFGRPIHLVSFGLLDNDVEVLPGKMMPQEVDVFFRQTARPNADDTSMMLPIIRVTQLLATAPMTLSEWFNTYEKLEPALQLFCTVLFQKDLNLQVAYLLSVQAAEVFDRRTSTAGLVSSEIYEAAKSALLAALPSATPASFKQKIEGVLNYINEPSLRQRLKRLVATFEDEFGSQPFGFNKSQITSVVDTRNYLTHYDASSAAKALDGIELYYTTRRLLALVLALFLKEIGLSAVQIRKALSDHAEFRQYV